MTQPTLDQIRIAELIEIEASDALYGAGTALGTDLGARHHRAGMVSYYAVDVDRGNTNMNRLRGVALEASRAVDLVAEAEQFFQPGTHYSVTIAPTTHAADV